MQIKDFIDAIALVGTELFPLSQSDNTRKVQLDVLKTFFTSDIDTAITNINTNGVINKTMPASFDKTKISTWTESGIYLTDSSGVLDLPSGWAQGRYIVVVFSNGNAAYSMQLISPYQGSTGTFKKLAFRNSIVEGSLWKELANGEEKTNTIFVSDDSDPLLQTKERFVCNHPNCPTNDYYYIQQFAFSPKTSDPITVSSNRTLLAFGYRNVNGLNKTVWFNSCFGGVWTGWQQLNTNLVTNANLTLYVNAATGSDTNDGLSSGSPFKTISKAISVIPQTVNHSVIINVASGTYNETISFQGFSGKSSISLYGGTDLTTAANFILNNVVVSRCTCPVTIRGFTASTTTTSAFMATSALSVYFYYCIATAATVDSVGFHCSMSTVDLYNYIASNKKYGVLSEYCGTMTSRIGSGTGNTAGLCANTAGTIGKYASQPSGTTAESQINGGVIR